MAELTPQQEAQLEAAFFAAFGVWLPAASIAVLVGYNRFGSPPDILGIRATSALWRQQVNAVMAQHLEPIARDAYEDQVSGMAGVAAFSIGLPIVAGAVAATAAFLAAQVGEVEGSLRHIARNSITITDAATAIAAYLNPNNAHWRSKARQFAQTEGDRWVQAATLAGAAMAERADGFRREKVWVSRDDELVRPAHAMADGQRRPLLAPFNVAGFPMMYPHDPAAPPDLVVNCRCGLRIEVNRGR
jgi:hypothetical protein